MTEEEALEELKSIADQWVKDPNLKICSLCLSQVPKETYDEHMEKHGYITIKLSYNE